jgi:nucleoid DNA-binding protein
MSMTKRDLVVKIARETGLIQQDVSAIVQMTLDGIADEVAAGKTVELRNFGVFKVIVRRSRKGRNPNRPKKTVIIPDRAVVKFRSGKELRTRVEALRPENLKN